MLFKSVGSFAPSYAPPFAAGRGGGTARRVRRSPSAGGNPGLGTGPATGRPAAALGSGHVGGGPATRALGLTRLRVSAEILRGAGKSFPRSFYHLNLPR